MLRTFLYLAMAFALAACQPAPVFRVDISMVRHQGPEVISGLMAARGFGVQIYDVTDPSVADAQVRFVNNNCRNGMVVSARRDSPFLVIDEECCARNAGIAYCVAHAMGHFLTTELHVCHQPTAAARGQLEFCDPRQSVAGRHLMGVGAETPWREISADEVWMTPTDADIRLMEIEPLNCRQGDDGRVTMLVKYAVEAAAKVANGYERVMATLGLPKAIGTMPWHAFWAFEVVRELSGGKTWTLESDFNKHNEPLSMVQWFQSGLPRFDLSHHAAVAFANTDCHNVSFEDARMPFSSLAIELPSPSPFSLKSIRGDHYNDVRMLRLNQYMETKQSLPDVDIASRDWPELERQTRNFLEPSMVISAVAEDGTVIYQRGTFRDDMTLVEWTQGLAAHGEDQEAARMMLNIAINTLVFLHAEGKRYVPTRPVARPRRGAHHANDSGYRPTIYRVGDNIRLNNLKELRDLSRETSRGGKRPPGWTLRSRSTVRGHWKQQAHGPGRALRKRVFVQPYWRGPQAAEALLRAYEVKP